MRNTLIITASIIILGLYFTRSPKESDDLTNEATKEIQNIKPVASSPPKKIVNKVSQKRILKLQPQQSTSPNAKYPGLGNDFVPFDEEGHRYITQIIQAGKHLVYHGDLLIGDAKDLDQIKKKGAIKLSKPKKWPNGKIPFKLDEDLSNYNTVLEAIEYYNQTTNLEFIPFDEQKNYIHITLGDSDCYSYVGMIGGMQEIFLTPQCHLKEIIHELTHTVGFFHEQNREDRDQYIEVLWNNIDDIYHTQFKKIPNDFLGISQRPFDFNSLMMYSSFTFNAVPGEPAMITKGGETIPASNNLLSEEDINRINLAYPSL